MSVHDFPTPDEQPPPGWDDRECSNAPPPGAHLLLDEFFDPGWRARLAETAVDQPFAVLDVAARQLSAAGPRVVDVVRCLHLSGFGVARTLAAAMEWLELGTVHSGGGGIPPWLAQPGTGAIIRAARRRVDACEPLTSYLLELRLPSGAIGTLHAVVDHSRGDRMRSAFVTDDALDVTRQILTACDGASPRYGEKPGPYRRIQPRTAQRALVRARTASDYVPFAVVPGNPWPAIRPLLSCVLDAFVVAVPP